MGRGVPGADIGKRRRAVKRRADYVDHVTRSFALLGESESQAQADANTILALETSLAKITIPQADMRDPVATYHKMPLSDFQQTTPHVNWTRYLQHIGVAPADLNVDRSEEHTSELQSH